MRWLLILALACAYAGSTSGFLSCPLFSKSDQLQRQQQVSGIAPAMVHIKIDVSPEEPFEVALRRFKSEVLESGHLMEIRHRRYFESSKEKQIRRVKEAQRRRRLLRLQNLRRPTQ
mmetsp:Transcript_26275/g.69048  ORF Transcript_26275/g.69048 Transcript_26275/m.69048 type:complete len:116 (-) Transcript_26275:127-474(-)